MPEEQSPAPGIRHYEVPPHDAGERLDRYLARQPDLDCSRSFLQRLIAEGQITLAGRTPRPSSRLQPGDVITVEVPPPDPIEALPQDLPLSVVWEDAHLLVVDKPPGLVVHPAPGHAQDTLVNALLYHCRDLSGIGGKLRPGIVHRLDQDTSGLLVVAKDDATHQGLSALFQQRDPKHLDRRYLALLQGSLPHDEGRIETGYGRHPRHRQRFTSRVDGPRQAITLYRVLQRFAGLSLVEVRLLTGRTHQIRVHFADQGRPLLGDPLYGSRPPRHWPKTLRQLPRQFLHAYRLAFTHPLSQKWISCTSPLPPDLAPLLEQLQMSKI